MDDCVHHPWIVDSDTKELLRIASESTARLSPQNVYVDWQKKGQASIGVVAY